MTFTKTICPRWQRLVQETIPHHAIRADKVRTFEYSLKGITRASSTLAGFVYYYYENKVDDRTLCEVMQVRDREHLTLLESDPDEFVVYADPNSSQAVLMRIEPGGKGAYSFNTKFEYWLLDPFDEKFIRGRLLKDPTKVKRREVAGKEVDVEVRFLKFLGGMAILYQNHSKNYVFNEELGL